MDESVICIEDSNEIIDLSETIEDLSENSRNNHKDFFIREKKKNKNGSMKSSIIDLSNESDMDPPENLVSELSLNPRKSCDICCPICFEKLSNVSVKATTCGHVFCSVCIESVIKVKKSCPKCRRKLTMKSLISLYL